MSRKFVYGLLAIVVSGSLIAACSKKSPTEPSPEPTSAANPLPAPEITSTPAPTAIPTPELNIRYEIIAEPVDPAKPHHSGAMQIRWANTSVTGYAIALSPTFDNSKWEASVNLRAGTAWLSLQIDNALLYPAISNTRYILTIFRNGTAVKTATHTAASSSVIDIAYDL